MVSIPKKLLLIKELIRNVPNAETYETIFDAKDLPGGVHYYKLKAIDPESGTRQLFDKKADGIKR